MGFGGSGGSFNWYSKTGILPAQWEDPQSFEQKTAPRHKFSSEDFKPIKTLPVPNCSFTKVLISLLSLKCELFCCEIDGKDIVP